MPNASVSPLVVRTLEFCREVAHEVRSIHIESDVIDYAARLMIHHDESQPIGIVQNKMRHRIEGARVKS